MRFAGNLSVTPVGRSIMLICEACDVWWTGCADAHECPKCGDPKDWNEEFNPIHEEVE